MPAKKPAATAETETTPPPEPQEEEAYMKRREVILARLPKEDDRPKNIYARLAQILGVVGVIPKTGRNAFHGYNYTEEKNLVEEIRPMLSEYGIWIEQSLATPEDGFVPHERRGQYKAKDDITVESLTVIMKKFRFVWWDPTAKQLQMTSWVFFGGYGDDTSDKGYNKAETSAVKYFLMKTFMVATGNDPEADKAADERAARREAGPTQVRRAPGRPAQPGGRQQSASSPQVRQIGELLRATGISTSAEAIAHLERLTGDKIAIPTVDDEPDLQAGLTAYLEGLPGPKAGEVVQKLRDNIATALETVAGAMSPAQGALPGANEKPAAAHYVEDEAAPEDSTKVWSEVADKDEAASEDASDDGTIESAIA